MRKIPDKQKSHSGRDLIRVVKMSEPKMVTAAIVISLVAGILIILGSIYPTIGGIWTILGVVSGIIVLISANLPKSSTPSN